MRHTTLVLTLSFLVPLPASAQYLKTGPVLYQDPQPTGNWQETPLVLGKTLLQSARRMFPNAPQVYDGRAAFSINQGNPQPIDQWDATWTVGGFTGTTKYIFQLGPGNWTLGFDANQRLIAAVAPSEMLKGVTHAEFAHHYPTLREVRGQSSSLITGLLQDCVSLTATFGFADSLQSYSYTYTCPTAPAP